MGSTSPLQPTFYGHIASTQDALLLFEACLRGSIDHVARRPHDRERAGLIQSGNVFIYEEHSSGIKRWTDGVPWSPSRILGNFLIYRELERPFPPGEKKRAMKKPKRPLTSLSGISKLHDTTQPRPASSSYPPEPATATSSALARETERQLIGSLVDSYGFKKDGLIKKTLSVTVAGISHHLVSYYNVKDVMENRLTTPSKDPAFQHLQPRQDLVTRQNFRTPIEEIDSMERDDRALYALYPFAPPYDASTQQPAAQRPVASPSLMTYEATAAMYPSYAASFGDTMSVVSETPAYPTTYSQPQPSAPATHLYPGRSDMDPGPFRPRYQGNAVGLDTVQMPLYAHTSMEDTKMAVESYASTYYGVDASTTQQRSHAAPAMPTNMAASFDRPAASSSYATLETRAKVENNWHLLQSLTGAYVAQANNWAASGT